MAEQSHPVKLAVNDAWPGIHGLTSEVLRKIWGKSGEKAIGKSMIYRYIDDDPRKQMTCYMSWRNHGANSGHVCEKQKQKNTYFGMVQND